MVEGNEAAIVLDFTMRYVEDVSNGVVRSFAEYLADYPGYETAVTRTWEELRQREDGILRVGPYRLILPELGRGGQGEVYLAFDPKRSSASSPTDDRLVAVKLFTRNMTERARARLEKEIEILQRLDDPNICRIIDDGEDGDRRYFVMPYVAGKSLRDQIDVWRDVDTDLSVVSGVERRATIVRWFIQCARALMKVHAQGVVHRDIKPANIMIRADGLPVLIDFGLVYDAERTISMSAERGAGTLLYMSPEQIGRADRLTPATDVYSLGVSLHEALILAPPFFFDERGIRRSPSAVENAIRHGELVRHTGADGVPQDLDAILQIATDLNPKRRPSMDEFAADLERFLDGLPVKARPVSVVVKTWRHARRRPVLASIIVASVILLATVAELTRRHTDELDRQIEKLDRANEELKRQSNKDRLDVVAGLTQELVERGDGLVHSDATATDMRRWLDDVRDVSAACDVLDLESRFEELCRLGEPTTPTAVSLDDERAVSDLEGLLGRLKDMPARWERIFEEAAEGNIQAAKGNIPDDDETADVSASNLAKIKAFFTKPPDFEPLERLVDENYDDTERRLEIARESRRYTSPLRFDCSDRDREYRQVAAILMRRLEIESPRYGLRDRIEAKLEFREKVVARTIEDYAEAWAQARRRVLGSERYSDLDLDLKPQTGLVPLGRDPDSNLEEFLHLGTHAPTHAVPCRDDAGRLPSVAAETGVILVLLPSGRYRRGAVSRGTESDINWNEGPEKECVVPAFLLSKYEMTRGQARRLFGYDPGIFLPSLQLTAGWDWIFRDRTTPAEGFSWSEIRRVLAGAGLVLPTETQWEYAARAGSDSRIPHLDQVGAGALSPKQLVVLARRANLAMPDSPQRVEIDGQIVDPFDPFPELSPVGSLLPNAFGFHDMIGNVSEMCRDAYSLGYGKPAGRRRIHRGDDCRASAKDVRVTRRFGILPSNGSTYIGVRPGRRLK